MKKEFFYSGILLLCVTVCFFSCKSTPKKEQSRIDLSHLKTLASLDEFTGVWEADDGSGFEYPFVCDGKKYVRIYTAKQENTWLWQNYADMHNISMKALLEKKFSCAADVYKTQSQIPVSDTQGIQYGIKMQVTEGGSVFGQEVYLVPERVLAVNFSFFCMSPDKTYFVEDGLFHFMSERFSDLTARQEVVYEKK